MNSFYIPALAGQIYAMPGMETKLHAVINQPGDYEGFSANYSGAGFSGMRFKFHGLSRRRLRPAGSRQAQDRTAATLDPRRLPEAGAAERARAGAPLRHGRRRPVPARSSTAASTRGKMCMNADDGHRRAPAATGKRRRLQRRLPRRLAARRRSMRRGPHRTSAAMCTRRRPRRTVALAPCHRPHPDETNDARPSRPDEADLRPPHAGRRSPATSRSCSRTFIAVALGGIVVLGALTYFRLWGYAVARLVHQHRPQEDRHHVHHPRPGDAAARLRRRHHDARPAGDRLRRRRGLPAAAPLRPDLHRPRRDHDLLRGDAAGHRPDELRRAAADRRARRGLPVPQQLQLLDDRGRRGAGDDRRCSSASSPRTGWLAYPPLSGMQLQSGRGGRLLHLVAADRGRRHAAVGHQPDRDHRQDARARHDA